MQGVGDDQSEKEKKQAEQRRWLQDLREWCVCVNGVCVCVSGVCVCSALCEEGWPRFITICLIWCV